MSALALSRPHPPSPGIWRSIRTRRISTALHVVGVLLVLFSTWGFGGQSAPVRATLTVLGCAGATLGLLLHGAEPGGLRRWIRQLWPLAALDAAFLLGALNPSFTVLGAGPDATMIPRATAAWLPSVARPAAALGDLVLFNGLILTAHAWCAALAEPRELRRLLFFLGLNALALAIFGTVQHLSRADGLWFGQVPSPNPRFFSTFIYPNHWGAFMLLHLALWVGVAFGAGQRGSAGRTSLAWAGTAALLLLVTAPLSGSRSTSVLAVTLLAAAGLALMRVLWRRHRPIRRWRPLLLAAGLGGASLGVAGWVARDAIAHRAQTTRDQLAAFAASPATDSRLTLYRDTWRMATHRPWFGWGWDSYAPIFRWFNTQRSVENLPGRPFYAEAHSDWLQSLAEVGLVGTALRVLLAGLWLQGIWRRLHAGGEAGWLVAGPAAIAAYSLLEFPFACPAVVLSFWLMLGAAARLAGEDSSRA